MKNNHGGAAAASGMDFQHRVSAWLAVRILAERAAPAPWDLGTTVSLEFLRCETEQPVDDILVGTSENGFAYIQVKKTLSLSEQANSEIASVFDQFVRQFIAYREIKNASRPWERPLESSRDRLVLATSSRTSEPIRVHLVSVLNRLRSLPSNAVLEDAASNNDERRVFSVITTHLRNVWQANLGKLPTNNELNDVLRLIRIQTFDFENSGSADLEAKRLLKTPILFKPEQCDSAWALLVSSCAQFASTKTGGGRAELQKILLQADININAPKSYHADIARLKEYSKTTLTVVEGLSKIRVGSVDVKIRRDSTIKLLQEAKLKPLLVVGEPGAGKSGALHDVANSLVDENSDVVFFAVDMLSAESLGKLRGELGLDRDIHDVLANWPGMHPAVLVIDALDAARAEPVGKTIRDLIRLILKLNGRWRVVASIRKFDLRYSAELQSLFAGTPSTEYKDDEFSSVCHLNVPRLSRAELNQIAPQSSLLQNLIDQAPGELQELLCVPFNLRLLAELLGKGIDPQTLTPLRTQLELLNLYWNSRVLDPIQKGDARESVLRKACNGMVEQRMLHIDLERVSDHANSETLNDLRSMQILSEWQPTPQNVPNRYVLSFSHHVLFDYAVARLLLRGDPAQLTQWLTSNPELLLVVRPSLVLHFRHLWANDPSQFWLFTHHLQQTTTFPEIGKIIGPAVCVESIHMSEDLSPLYLNLEGGDEAAKLAATQILNNIVGAIVAGVDQHPLIGKRAAPWAEVAERISRNMIPNVSYALANLLDILCQKPQEFLAEQRISAGLAARRLLDYAWTMPTRDRYLVIRGIHCVCCTFESNQEDAARVLRVAIMPEHLQQYGHEEVFWIAREMKRLITIAPSFVEEVYGAIFAHEETSDAKTAMGNSRILSLTSNRRQDYHAAIYELANIFKDYLAAHPGNATRVLVHIVESYVKRKHATTATESSPEFFDFYDKKAWTCEDYSSIWDEGSTYDFHDELKMLRTFQSYMKTLEAQADGDSRFSEILEIIIRENKQAILWRRLLMIGTEFPKTFGKQLAPLAWALPIIKGMSTTTVAGNYIKAVFLELPTDQRKLIENAIISIPSTSSPLEKSEFSEHMRNRLIGCLPEEAITTDAVKHILGDLKAKNAVPKNTPLIHFTGMTSTPYSEEEYLKDEGVPVAAEPNRRVRELAQPANQFAQKHLNSVPLLEDALKLLPELRTLHETLKHADEQGVHSKQRDYGWGHLAEACNRIVQIENIDHAEELAGFVRNVLLEASTYPDPIYHPEYDSQFDDHPSWGSPAARIPAAEGLILMARNPVYVTKEVLDAIRRLSRDSVPAVRFHIARRLTTLYKTAPDLMWECVTWYSEHESSRGVIQGLLSSTLSALAGNHAERIVGLIKTIHDRVQDGAGVKKVKELCVSLFTKLFIWRNTAGTREVVFSIAGNPEQYSHDCQQILLDLRDELTHGPIQAPKPEEDAVRARTLELFAHTVSSACKALSQFESRNEPWSEADQKKARAIAQVVDSAASEIYFASGAYDLKEGKERPEKNEMSIDIRDRFYRETVSILDMLTDVGITNVTYYLLQTLEAFIPIDPPGIFIRIGHVVESGKKGGYQFESLAADLMVELIERYLAEYRSLLRENEQCRNILIKTLDIFVSAGWPSARRLTYRLEEIFR